VIITGWSDDRFMDAHDAIAAIVRDHSTPDDKLPEIKALLTAIEKADDVLRALLAERMAA